jgi:hypothetical protein
MQVGAPQHPSQRLSFYCAHIPSQLVGAGGQERAGAAVEHGDGCVTIIFQLLVRLTIENYTISLIQASRKGFLGWVTAGECAAILCAHASGLAAVDVSQDGRAVVR